jgi:hypothetical protein
MHLVCAVFTVQAAQLQSLRSSLAAGAAGNLYGSSYTQVLLELMLLDAGLAKTCNSSSNFNCIMAPAGAGCPASSSTQQLLQDSSSGEQAVEAAAAAAAAASGVTLSVLVSAAVNLPLVPG